MVTKQKEIEKFLDKPVSSVSKLKKRVTKQEKLKKKLGLKELYYLLILIILFEKNT